MVDYIFLFWYVYANDNECKLSLMEDPIAKASNAFALKKNSPYLEEMNEVIQRLVDDEKINDMKKKWMTKFCQPVFLVPSKTALSIESFGGLIMVLCVTMVLCFPLLLPETLYYKYHIHLTLAAFIKKKLARKKTETFEEVCTERLNSSIIVNRLGVVKFPENIKARFSVT